MSPPSANQYSSAATQPPLPAEAASPLATPSPADLPLYRHWGLLLLRGLIAVLFGLTALLLPGPTMASLILLFAAYLLVDGTFALITAIRVGQRRERWGWFLVEGVVNIAVGVAALVWSGTALVALIWTLAFWGIASGACMVAGALRLRKKQAGRGWLGFSGGISMVWGVLLFLFPIAGAVFPTVWLGAYALLFGISLTILAFRLRKRARTGGYPPGMQPA